MFLLCKLMATSSMYLFIRLPWLEPQGFCQVEKNPKIREKLGNGWVGQAPTRILIIFLNVVSFCDFCVVFMFPKKIG